MRYKYSFPIQVHFTTQCLQKGEYLELFTPSPDGSRMYQRADCSSWVLLDIEPDGALTYGLDMNDEVKYEIS